MQIKDWQKQIFANALAKGFHTETTDHHSPMRIGARLALIHSELSEALEEVSRGRRELWYSEGDKPEGLGIELADTAIRLLDLAESLGLEIQVYSHVPALMSRDPESLGNYICYLHDLVSQISDWRNTDQMDVYMDQLLGAIVHMSNRLGIDIWSMISLKHEFNKTRPLRHGGKAL